MERGFHISILVINCFYLTYGTTNNCPAGADWFFQNNICYRYFVERFAKTRANAKTECENNGRKLLLPKSRSETDFIINLNDIKSHTPACTPTDAIGCTFWIMANFVSSNNMYMDENYQYLQWTNWNSGNPYNPGVNCAAMFENGTWDIAYCNGHRLYICVEEKATTTTIKTITPSPTMKTTTLKAATTTCRTKSCDYCSPNPCEHGVCLSKPNSQFPKYNYTCICPDRYEGPKCTLIDDPCVYDPNAKCKYNGTCKTKEQPGKNDWFCICPWKPIKGEAKDCSGGNSEKTSLYKYQQKIILVAAIIIPCWLVCIGWVVCCICECVEQGEIPTLGRDRDEESANRSDEKRGPRKKSKTDKNSIRKSNISLKASTAQTGSISVLSSTHKQEQSTISKQSKPRPSLNSKVSHSSRQNKIKKDAKSNSEGKEKRNTENKPKTVGNSTKNGQSEKDTMNSISKGEKDDKEALEQKINNKNRRHESLSGKSDPIKKDPKGQRKDIVNSISNSTDKTKNVKNMKKMKPKQIMSSPSKRDENEISGDKGRTKGKKTATKRTSYQSLQITADTKDKAVKKTITIDQIDVVSQNVQDNVKGSSNDFHSFQKGNSKFDRQKKDNGAFKKNADKDKNNFDAQPIQDNFKSTYKDDKNGKNDNLNFDGQKKDKRAARKNTDMDQHKYDSKQIQDSVKVATKDDKNYQKDSFKSKRLKEEEKAYKKNTERDQNMYASKETQDSLKGTSKDDNNDKKDNNFKSERRREEKRAGKKNKSLDKN